MKIVILGWSERLELQEQFMEAREEQLEEYKDSLVSCMVGEEGRGGAVRGSDQLFQTHQRESEPAPRTRQDLQGGRLDSASRSFASQSPHSSHAAAREI